MSLSVEEVTFGYPGAGLIIRDLSLVVEFGSSAAITAPSGTGKSTLLGVIGGLRKPSAGSVIVSGDLRAASPKFAWVFQSMHLMAQRTALDNVSIALLSRGVERGSADARAREELERFGVGHLAGRRQGSLSGGESQRVALARAAVADPLVVLADEPTANLDEANARHVGDVLMGGFPKSALVVATHDASLARRATASYVLHDGALVPSSRGAAA